MMENEELVKRGIAAVFARLGLVDSIKFFQSIGIQRGDTLKEIEGITQSLTRKEALELVKNAK